MKLWSKIKSLFVGSASTATSTSTSTDTEFSAEVVRITQVLPHPNADRLEIARFEMRGIGETAYEVVIQKGTAKPGDLMAYFSVDCVVPTGHPDFQFLTKRPDGEGKTRFRLRAARLRGVFSQGLLVPAPSGCEWGAQVADLYGVTYYRQPEAAGAESPITIGKPKRQVFPIYGVDSLKKLPRLFEEGEPVVITEKIHGTNFRFGWVRRKVLGIPLGWRFVCGSHRTIKGGRGNHYYGEDVWWDAAEKMDLARKTRDYRGYTFYGELYGYTYGGKRIQDLTYGRKPEDGPGLAIFDIRTPNGNWMSPFQREVACADCDLPEVPDVGASKRGVFECIGGPEAGFPFSARGVLEVSNGPSYLDPGQIREGVVVESIQGPRRKAKFVGEQYLTRKEAQ